MANKAFMNAILMFFLTSALFCGVSQVFGSTSEGTMEWNKTYGGTGHDLAQSMVLTSDGGYALTGHTVSFGAGKHDAWLVRTDSTGNEVWSKTYGGKDDDQAWSVVQTSDGGYALAGYTNSTGAGDYDFWLVKTDSTGNEVWSKTFGGTRYDGAEAIIVTDDGGYALAGYTLSFGAGNNDFWLVKTDAGGNQLWSKTYGGTGYDYAFSVVQTSDGGYALTGFTNSFGGGKPNVLLVKTDAGGNQLWSRTFGGKDDDRAFSVVQTSDGGYALAGYTNSTGAGDYDFWLVKTDSTGNEVWSKTYGGMYWDGVESMISTGDGGYALAGYTRSLGSGRNDAWLVKTDSTGNHLWNNTYGGIVNDYASSVVVTSDGGYTLAGFASSFGAGSYDFWLINIESVIVQPPKLSPAGGTYSSVQTVTISCSTEGATIRYTTDGSEPTTTSTSYASPIIIDATITVKAKAFKDGMIDSDTATATYTINVSAKVSTPIISPAGGTYSLAQNVTMSCSTEGAVTRYTTDGTEPTTTSTQYARPIIIDATTAVKAKAFKDGMIDSDTATATYTVNLPVKIPAPTFFPAGGTYSSVQTVTISCSTEGATIRYTTDGSEPTTTSTLYMGSIKVSSSMMIKAKIFKDGLLSSDTATAVYSINIAEPSSNLGTVSPAVLYSAIIIVVAAIGAVVTLLLKKPNPASPSIQPSRRHKAKPKLKKSHNSDNRRSS